MGERMFGREVVERILAVAALGTLLATAGCGAFFQCEGKASCKSSSSTTTVSGDFAYITNSTSGSDYIGEYNLSSGTLVAIGSPVTVPFTPVAMAVGSTNAFLYVASPPSYTPNPGIYLYSIGTTGALTAANSGGVLVTDTVASMTVSPDGNWLYTISEQAAGTQLLTQYSVNKTTGLLSAGGQFTLPTSVLTGCVLPVATSTAPPLQQCSVSVAPNENYVLVTVGTANTVVFPYTSSGGITSANYVGAINSSSQTYRSGVMDKNNFIHLTGTTDVELYAVPSATVSGSLDTKTTNLSTPQSIITNGTYLYVANVGSSTISGYSVGSDGKLTDISGSPYSTAAKVSSLAFDNSGKYVLAVGFDASTGLQLLTIGSTGALTVGTNSVGTGALTTSSPPAVVVTTH